MNKNLKLLLFALSFGIIPFFINAQESSFGLKGGLNFSTFYTENIDDENILTGLHFGIYSRSPLVQDMVYLQTELGYSVKGSKIEGNAGEAEIGLGYLELPVMLSVGIANLVYLEGGVYGSYLLNTDISGESSAGSFSDEIDKDNFKDFDYGLAIGANLNLSPFVVGVRYYYGMQDIVDNDLAQFAGLEAKNSALQAYLAFEF